MIDLRELGRQLDAEEVALAAEIERIGEADGLSQDARALIEMIGVSARAIHHRQAEAIMLSAQTNV